jgi:hypothetical protein
MKIEKLLLLAAASAAVFASSWGPALGKSGGFAVVESDGSLARGTKGVTATRIDSGKYEVDFAGAVKKCAFTATTGSSGDGTPAFGVVTVAGRLDNPAGIYVVTYGSKGDAEDLAFVLNVSC